MTRGVSEFRRVLRALRNRCPQCGIGRPFRWLSMEDVCSECGARHEHKEPGFFLGATYINYGFSAVILVGGTFLLWGVFEIPFLPQLFWLVPFAVLAPLWFFGRSRLLWLVFADPTSQKKKPATEEPPDFEKDIRFAKRMLWAVLGLTILIGLVLFLQR